MKKITISDIHKTTGTNPAPTHRYDPHAKKIYDVETHRHLVKVREDLAAGHTVWVPKTKRSNS
jgi:hypothetical protein